MVASRCSRAGRRQTPARACLLGAIGLVCIASRSLLPTLFTASRLSYGHGAFSGRYSRLLQSRAVPEKDELRRILLAEEEKSAGADAAGDARQQEEKRADVAVEALPEESSGAPRPGAIAPEADAQAEEQTEDEEDWVERTPLAELEAGQHYSATVLSVFNYGTFVDFGAEVNALVPRSCMVAGDVRVFPQDVVQEGDEIDIWVAGVKDDGKVVATMVEGLVPPPTKAELTDIMEMEPGKWLKAKVVRLRGAFADIDVNIVGDHMTPASVHISQLSEDFVDKIEDVVQVGQEIDVKFLRVHRTGNLDFTMLENPKRPQRSWDGGEDLQSRPRSRDSSQWRSQDSDDWSSRERRAPPRSSQSTASVESFAVLTDKWFDGTVTGVKAFGAFVDIEHPETGEIATGLVHVSQMANDYVDHPGSVVQMGQTVECWIMDVKNGKINLSMRTE